MALKNQILNILRVVKNALNGLDEGAWLNVPHQKLA